MKNAYIAPEVIEVGNAGDVILSSKATGASDNELPIHPDSDLDD